VFNTYSSVKFSFVPIRQMYGKKKFLNIVDNIEDLKVQFIKFYYLKFSKMETKHLYTKDIV
jgi:hypothetical protein